jgi:hypothetical protein
MARAVSFGVVFSRSLGNVVVRIINPDFEWQLDIQVLSADEYLIRVPKEAFGVARERDAMTLDQVYRICETLGPRP